MNENNTEIDKRAQGKRNRRKGRDWELKVRNLILEDNKFICKFMNNVNLEENRMIAAKHKFNPFMRIMSIGSGFPDFIFWAENEAPMGLECKVHGVLTKIEKEKIKWLLDHKVFSKIYVVSQDDIEDFKFKLFSN